jgi:hypothetical protein
MSADDLDATRAMAERVRRFSRPDRADAPHVPITAQRAIAEQLVLWIDYLDRNSVTGETAPVRDPERFLEFMPWLVERPDPLR